MGFTDSYAEQSCIAGRSSFITGQGCLRTGFPNQAFLRRRSGCRPRPVRVERSLEIAGEIPDHEGP
jgi:hypothetical protein